MTKLTTCDIFCAVVDNYGDIGVCWRLAKQLAHEHGMMVRLWVDDLASFRRLCPSVDASLAQQHCRGVEVRHWTADTFPPLSHPLSPSRLRPPRFALPASGRGWPSGREGGVADLVIEAFACELPQRYVAAMAAQSHSNSISKVKQGGDLLAGSCPLRSDSVVGGEANAVSPMKWDWNHKAVWINLEYLSAEDWVAGCHRLPSPHPSWPLVKYFFFPGYTAQTGGLLLERDLLMRRDAFQGDPQAIASYWQSLGVPQAKPDETRVSLFSYENPALPELFSAWAAGNTPVCCLAPEGRALPQVAAFFGRSLATPGDMFERGNLRVHVLPFVEQERYDELLWACDLNFVRGEDSCVRAQWAGQPFVWHIYPQHDGVHLQKLRALMALYCAGLPPEAAHALHVLWEGWNPSTGSGCASGQAWNDFWKHRAILRHHAQAWAQQLSSNNLTLNLLNFFRKIEGASKNS